MLLLTDDIDVFSGNLNEKASNYFAMFYSTQMRAMANILLVAMGGSTTKQCYSYPSISAFEAFEQKYSILLVVAGP